MPSIEASRVEGRDDEQQQSSLELTEDEKSRIERIIRQMPSDGGLIDASGSRLSQPISRSQIQSGEGVEFSVAADNEEDPDAELLQGLFRDPAFLQRMAQVGISDDEQGGEEEDDKVSLFERKRRTMTDVFPDPASERHGVLFKRVKKFGSGSPPPPDALVTFHYTLLSESQVEPFDSTRQHFDAKPYTKRLNSGSLIIGIDWALASMCKGERSQFFIRPEAFLGERGAPPRIPGGEPVLADIELVSFCDSHSVDAFYSRDEEERRQVPFRVQLGVVQSLRHSAKELYKRAMYFLAFQKYRCAESVLTSMNITNDEEEVRMNRELAVICVNKAMTLYKLGKFPSAVRECNEALKRNERNSKALLWRGEALCSMGQHTEAAKTLEACRRIHGTGLSTESRARIEEAIRRNDDELRKDKDRQRQVYRKMATGLVGPAGKASVRQQQQQHQQQAEQLQPHSALYQKLSDFLADASRPNLVLGKSTLEKEDCVRLVSTAKALDASLTIRETQEIISIIKAKPVPTEHLGSWGDC